MRRADISEEIKLKVIFNYLEKKMSLINSGKEFGLTQRNVEAILKEYNVKKRTYTEAKQLSRKYPCNDDYFKVQSHNMAYILGLLAADGSVSLKENLISIQLKKEDKQLLEQIRLEVQSQRPISDYDGKKDTISTLRVWSKTWKDDLAHYGIIPKKTFTLQPPLLLSKQYIIDYIRGYFDGDGSIYQIKSENRVFVEIAGVCRQEINWIRDHLINTYYIIPNKETTEQKENGTIIYKIKIGDKNEINKLYHLFYDNNSLFLERKKEKFELLLNIPRDSNSLDEE